MELLLLTRRWLLVAVLLPALGGCTAVFFQPHPRLIRDPAAVGLAYQEVWLTAADGVQLHAWYLPAEGRACGSVLFLHGNAENISTHLASVYWMPSKGFNVLLLDYRGYGLSRGTPSLPGVQMDIEAAMQHLRGRSQDDGVPIAIFGQSFGGAAGIYYAAHAAEKDHIGALVAESAFASHRAIAREKLSGFWLTWPLAWPLAYTISDAYSPVVAVKNVSPIPLLLVHGDRDAIVPLHHSERLYASAVEPKEFWRIEGAGHIDAFRSEVYRKKLAAYLAARLCPTSD